MTPRRFIANVSACAVTNQTFCVEDGNYPLDVIQRILNTKGKEFANVFNNEVLVFDTIANRDSLDAIDLCDSYPDVYYPKSAKNKNGAELYIFNTDTHKQGVRVGMCRNTGRECKGIVTVPNGYRTECTQTHVYHELLSLSPDGQTIKESFSFPACCTCAAYRI